VLDAGCGSGRLTVALAQAGHQVTGIDANEDSLRRADERAREAGVELSLHRADIREPLSLEPGALDAVVSRLVLMIPGDTSATIRNLCQPLVDGGVVGTAVWAHVEENGWFCEPRAVVEEVLGADDAAFARAFGRLGSEEELAGVHRAAGLTVTGHTTLRDPVHTPDAAAHWATLARDNGHYRRLDARLSADDRQRLLSALERRLEQYRHGDELVLARTVVLVTAEKR
jgi:2-polyprenyl-3-methyl-5-hydroxy-6-metoxy-1,4-benzoquinol methylase